MQSGNGTGIPTPFSLCFEENWIWPLLILLLLRKSPGFLNVIGNSPQRKLIKSLGLINSKNGIGMVRAIKHLVSKRLVNVYKYNGLQLTVNSVSELREARNKIGKYVTFS